MTRVDPLSALAGIVERAWVVGGAVRDRLLGRVTVDVDVALPGGVADAARALGRRAGGFAFSLSESFGAWRVVAHDRRWQLDLLPLGGGTIEEDLAQRDLTINAIAEPLHREGYVDPFGGLEDLRRRRLRAVRDDAFARDPLRTMRLARLACELGFEADPQTLALARASAPGLARVAPERVFAELRRVMIADRAVQGLRLLDEVGAAAAVLPELVALRGVEQSRYHHLDVFEHTLAVVSEAIALDREPDRLANGEDALALRRLLGEPLGNELTRAQALRFGALLHDIAKPQTRAVTPEGRVTFMGHDAAGAALSADILARLRAGERLREHVAALARHHLRLGFLVHEMPLGRRAVYDYLHATTPVAVDVTLLSVADRLATRGDNAERAIARHVELARQMVAEGLAWAAHPPRPPVRGDELMRALGLAPGPAIGGLLAELEAASFSGEVRTREEAIERARQLVWEDGKH